MAWLFFGLLSLALGALVYALKAWGRAEAEKDIAEDESEHANRRNEIDEKVSGMSDTDLRDRLKRMLRARDRVRLGKED